MNAIDLEEILGSIRLGKQYSDLLIATIHSHDTGLGCDEPGDFLPVLAHAAIDAGAGAFLGTGEHRLMPIEIYKGRPIFYSLANFFWSDMQEPLPADLHEQNRELLTTAYGDAAKATDADLNAVINADGFDDERVFQTVVATIRWEGNRVAEVRLYPVDLRYGEPLTRAAFRGWLHPRWADRSSSASSGSRSPTGRRSRSKAESASSASPSPVDQDLPRVEVRAHPRERLRGAIRRKARVDRDSQRIRVEPREDLFAEARDDPRLLLPRAGPERRADEAPALGQQQSDVELGARSGQRGQEHHAALPRENAQVSRERVGADGVEDHGDRVAPPCPFDHVGKRSRRRVDGEIAPAARIPSSLAALRVVAATARAQEFRRLDRREPDARGACVDQHPFSPPEHALDHEVEVRGQEGLGNRGGVGERESPRRREHLARRNGGVLRVGPASDERTDMLARLDHGPGELETEDFRLTRRRRNSARRSDRDRRG